MSDPVIDHVLSEDFTGKAFQERRQRIASAIGEEASALLQAAPRPATAHPVFEQSKVFHYVSGILLERCYLLIDGKDARTTLFVPSEGLSNIRGGVLTEQAKATICARMLIDRISTIDDLKTALSSVSTLYILKRPEERVFATKFAQLGTDKLRAADPFDRLVRRDESLAANIKAFYPAIKVEDLDPIICKMRTIKSPAEIDILRVNGSMSAKVCMESMKATKPGLKKEALHAVADYIFRITGNSGHAYDYILEPTHNDADTLLDGDLVLVDCAPAHKNYTMDIGRIWPVNGVFNPEQRHLYTLVTDYHKALLKLTKAGRMVQKIYDEAAAIMLDAYRADAKGTAILNLMIERGIRYLNHHVGLSPHDAIDRSWRETPLKAGMVIALDPMVSVPNGPHGCVRVEDTIVITEDGCERLTGSAPIDIDAIEALMQQNSAFPLELSL